MKAARGILTCLIAALMTACATPPATKAPSKTQPTAATSSLPVAIDAQTTATVTSPTTAEPEGNVWNELRGRFAMADCDADPGIMLWARRYTQNPQRFEMQMRNALPQLVYVQQVAEKYDVAGEFVLLPWVESQFQPVTGQRNRPAGMWQIVPSTGHVLGLHIDRGYDGRLDTPAATESVMQMLSRYHEDLQDWRLVDYAFNTGEFGLRKVVNQHGLPPAEPAIPKLPVSRVTREHLTKLLAISCVIREPSRFNVELPELPSDEHLEKVQVTHSMSVAAAANHAGMQTDALTKINPALRSGQVDTSTSTYLLMPHRNAQQWRDANASQNLNDQDLSASVGQSPTLPALPNETKSPSIDAEDVTAGPQASNTRPPTHVVRPGETLWQIARKYSVSIKALQRWNHLDGKTLKPGLTLKLRGND